MDARKALPALLLAAGFCAHLQVHAQATPELEPYQQGAVKYLNGGAGDEERALMRSRADEYPLQIVLSARDGAYAVADSLTIANRHGALVRIKDAGPIVMLNLPPGPYALEATFDGVGYKRSVNVGLGARQLSWVVPSAH